MSSDQSIQYPNNYADGVNFSRISITGANTDQITENNDNQESQNRKQQSKIRNVKGSTKSKKSKKIIKQKNQKIENQQIYEKIVQLNDKIEQQNEQIKNLRNQHKKSLDHMKNKLIQQFKRIFEKMELISNNNIGTKVQQKKKWQTVELKKIEGIQGNEPRKIRKVDKEEIAARTYAKNMNQQLFFHKNPSENIPFQSQILCPVNPKSRYIKRFIITKNQFKLDCNDYTILVAKPLQLKQESMMTILNTRFSNIWLGLIDQQHLSSKPSPSLQGCILYSAQDGSVSQDGKVIMRSGNGYRIGERVGVTFTTDQGVVSWTLNCRFKCQYTSEKLKDTRIKWVPVIAMKDRGDIVKWEQHSIQPK